MRILYGITKSNFGGAQRYVFDLATESKKRGHDVAVMCGGNGILIDKLREAGIRTIVIPGFGRNMDLLNDAPRLLFIIRTVWREKPDVFHINSAKMGGAGIFSGRILGVPRIIFTAHGWAFNESRPRWQKFLIKFFSWLIVLFAHKTICVSEKTKQDISSWPFTDHKFEVIHNGVDEFELVPREEAREQLGVQGDELVVGTLAELHKVKGLDILLQSWQTLSVHAFGKLLILGQGEEAKNLQNMAKNINLGVQLLSVRFLGFVENARALLSGFDIFVLPSRSEALPYAILEAGYAGLPTIASAVGGIPEIIINNTNGLLVEPENSSDLADKLQILMKDANLRARLGKKLKETISNRFSKSQMFDKTILTYR
ncbi:MAG: glycosyltransferase [bacterium]